MATHGVMWHISNNQQSKISAECGYISINISVAGNIRIAG